MLTARERVVPPMVRGAWWRCGVAGLAIGLMLGIAGYWILGAAGAWIFRNTGWPTWMRVAVWPAGLMPVAMVPISLLLRATQRAERVAASAIGIAVGSTLGTVVAIVPRLGDGGTNVGEWITRQSAMLATLLGIAFVAMTLLHFVIARVFRGRMIEHREGMCRKCGYELGGERIILYPECGADSRTTTFTSARVLHAVGWCAGHCGSLMALAGLVLGIAAAWPVWTRTIPSSEFYFRFRNATRVLHSAPSISVDPDLPTVWIESAELPDRGLRVMFDPVTTTGSRSVVVDMTGAPASGLPLGAAHVVANLDGVQTAWVLRNGLPRELVDALYAKAAEVAWMPASAPRGEWEVRARPEWFGE